MSSAEPGLDRHEWESEMALLEDDLRTSPVDALPEFVDLVHRMLEDRGYAPDEPAMPEDPEVVGEFRQARTVAESASVWDDHALGDVAERDPAAFAALRGPARRATSGVAFRPRPRG